jgi:hypothetical protein
MATAPFSFPWSTREPLHHLKEEASNSITNWDSKRFLGALQNVTQRIKGRQN